ncbi:GNAT family N-acetyltransferase [Castellaniella sp.]|uniref:GNAT family N-acetyltransferase n=1 Tax=Castellaniella sp. TaxID=1955812 RepID=UPI00356A7BAA
MAKTAPSPNTAEITVEVADPLSSDAQACMDAYFAELQARFTEGFDPHRSVSATPEELRPPAGYLLIARLGARVIGCGGLKIEGHGYGEIKRMWVSPTARGAGVAQRLLDALEMQAAEVGLDVIRLDTHRSLTAAQRLYVRNGYREIEAYNANPYAHYWYEKRGIKALRP